MVRTETFGCASQGDKIWTECMIYAINAGVSVREGGAEAHAQGLGQLLFPCLIGVPCSPNGEWGCR